MVYNSISTCFPESSLTVDDCSHFFPSFIALNQSWEITVLLSSESFVNLLNSASL